MKNKSKYIGVVYIMLAALCFALMNLFVKLSGDYIPVAEKSFFRNIVSVFISLAVIFKNKIKLEVPKEARLAIFCRCAFGTVGVLGNFYAIGKLDIADASMLNKLSPFFAIIFSFFLLKEKVKPFAIMCVIIAFIGALCIIQPGAGGMVAMIPGIAGFFGGMGAGLAYTFVRIASSKGAKGPIIVFCFSVFSCLVTLPLIIANPVALSARSLAMLLLAGTAASGGQFAITAAYSHAPAREISVYDYMQVVFAAILGWIFLAEIPNRLSVLGYIIICGAGITMFIYNNIMYKRTMEELENK